MDSLSNLNISYRPKVNPTLPCHMLVALNHSTGMFNIFRIFPWFSPELAFCFQLQLISNDLHTIIFRYCEEKERRSPQTFFILTKSSRNLLTNIFYCCWVSSNDSMGTFSMCVKRTLEKCFNFFSFSSCREDFQSFECCFFFSPSIHAQRSQCVCYFIQFIRSFMCCLYGFLDRVQHALSHYSIRK
jgi:hypothetical protein